MTLPRLKDIVSARLSPGEKKNLVLKHVSRNPSDKSPLRELKVHCLKLSNPLVFGISIDSESTHPVTIWKTTFLGFLVRQLPVIRRASCFAKMTIDSSVSYRNYWSEKAIPIDVILPRIDSSMTIQEADDYQLKHRTGSVHRFIF